MLEYFLCGFFGVFGVIVGVVFMAVIAYVGLVIYIWIFDGDDNTGVA